MPFHIMDASEEKELDEWLTTKDIVINHRTRRDLSDVVKVAQLFKNIDRKLVDLKNYTSHSKLATKLLNWETFNMKVLRKTGLMLMRPSLQKLAMGEVGALRSLLFHVMRFERNYVPRSARGQSPTSSIRSHGSMLNAAATKDEQESSGNRVYINANRSDGHVDPECEELMRICRRQDECINTLNVRVQHLEEVIIAKDKRISQLYEYLSKLTEKVMLMQLNHEDNEHRVIITEL